MHAFGRLTSILLFVLSLSFLTCAAPTTSKPQALALRGDEAGNAVLAAVVDLRAKLKVQLDACAPLSDVSAATTLVATIVADVEACVDVVATIDTKVNVSADIKAKIAAEIAAVIQIVVKICASLVAKLGVTVALALCVQIDAIMKILLVTLDACVSGVIALCVKLLVDIDAKVLLKLNLDLVAHILGLIKLDVLAAVGVKVAL